MDQTSKAEKDMKRLEELEFLFCSSEWTKITGQDLAWIMKLARENLLHKMEEK